MVDDAASGSAGLFSFSLFEKATTLAELSLVAVFSSPPPPPPLLPFLHNFLEAERLRRSRK